MQFENTEIEDAVITAMHDEGLSTYTAIAKEIDEDAVKVYDTLNELCRRGIVFRSDVTKEFHLNNGEPQLGIKARPETPKKRGRRGSYISVSKAKVDFIKIEECAARGFTHDQTADALGIPQNTYYSYRRGDNALAENINAAFKRGQKTVTQKEGLAADAETASPALAAQCSAVEQGGEARVGASKPIESTESLKTRKEVEEPIALNLSKPYGFAREHPDDEHVIRYSTLYPPIASKQIKLPNGMVVIRIHSDLFGASKLERDFIESLVEVVEGYNRQAARV